MVDFWIGLWITLYLLHLLQLLIVFSLYAISQRALSYWLEECGYERAKITFFNKVISIAKLLVLILIPIYNPALSITTILLLQEDKSRHKILDGLERDGKITKKVENDN